MQLSAGILLHRSRAGMREVLLIHPGGPFWSGKDVWMIPKGRVEPGEAVEDAARREFEEELGSPARDPLHSLGRVRQAGGKWVEAFALEGDLDPDAITSNMTSLEWPARSGRIHHFPEVDRAAWFTLAAAREKMLASQQPFLERLEDLLGP